MKTPSIMNKVCQQTLVLSAGLILGVLSGRAQTNEPVAEAAAPAAAPAASPTVVSPTETVPAGTDQYDLKSFKIIADRNIFNPNRSSRSSGRNQSAPPERRPIRIDTFSMVGMLRSDKGAFAFFDGSSSEFRKAVKEGETLGGFKVTEVGQDFAKLTGGEKEIKLVMGMTMKKQDEGEWQLIQKQDSSTTSTSGSSASSAPITDDEDPIVKKMMQNRDKESK